MTKLEKYLNIYSDLQQHCQVCVATVIVSS